MIVVVSISLAIIMVAMAARHIESLLALYLLGQPVLSFVLSLGRGEEVGRFEAGVPQVLFSVFVIARVAAFLAAKRDIALGSRLRAILGLLTIEMIIVSVGVYRSPQLAYGLLKLWSHVVFEIGGFVLAALVVRSADQLFRFLVYCVVFGAVTVVLVFVFLFETYGTAALLLRFPAEDMILYGFRLSSSLTLAYRLATCAVIALTLLFVPTRRYALRALLLVFSGACLYLVVATATRGATIFLLCAAAYIPLRAARHMKTKVLSIAILVVAATLTMSFVATDVKSRFRETTVGERTAGWAFGVELGLREPLSGVGVGGYGAYEIAVGNFTYPHNMLVEYFAEMGLPGLIVICLFYGMTGKAAYRAARLRAAPLIAVSAMFVIGCGAAALAGTMGTSDVLWVAAGLLYSPALESGRSAVTSTPAGALREIYAGAWV